jgi:hypothetical protein
MSQYTWHLTNHQPQSEQFLLIIPLYIHSKTLGIFSPHTSLSLSLSRESQLGITLPFKKCHSFNNLCNRRRGASFNNKLNSPRRDSLHTHFLLLLCTPFPHTPSLISYPSSVMLNFSLVHPHHFTESPVPKVNSYQYGKSQTGKV